MRKKVKKFFLTSDFFLEKVSMPRVWRVLVFLAMGVALWFSAIAGYGLFQYLRLGASTSGAVQQWGVKELSSSRFVVEAFFEYQVDGIKYQGKKLLRSPVYLNPFAAEEAIKTQRDKPYVVWYQVSNPEICSLQKAFPVKSVLHALLTLGVLFYFAIAPKRLPFYGLEQERISPLNSSS